MLYRTLGATGLRVSVLGLGTGTRFGDPRQNSAADAARLVRAALDFGINYIDTAAIYGEAEAQLGAALAGVPRERFIIATKFWPVDAGLQPITPAELRASVNRSLQRLRVETIDVLQIHGLRPAWLGPVMDRLGPELAALREQGRYRYLGVSETIVEDPVHEMVPWAAADGRFAAALIGYNPLSPWAEHSTLPACEAVRMGVIAMVAIGRALRDPAKLERLIREARERGEPGVANLPRKDPLGWLRDAAGGSMAAAGLRFAASHPAVATVLAGTLDVEHLRENVTAACRPPLPEEVRARVRRVFLNTDAAYWRPGDV